MTKKLEYIVEEKKKLREELMTSQQKKQHTCDQNICRSTTNKKNVLLFDAKEKTKKKLKLLTDICNKIDLTCI